MNLIRAGTADGTQSVPYELWDICSGDQVGSYDTPEAALAVVCEIAAARGAAYAEYYWLGRRAEDGRAQRIAEGRELLAQAHAEDRARVRSATG